MSDVTPSYTVLTEQQQVQIVMERVQQHEAEHFRRQLQLAELGAVRETATGEEHASIDKMMAQTTFEIQELVVRIEALRKMIPTPPRP